jgi:hypothetical protein
MRWTRLSSGLSANSKSSDAVRRYGTGDVATFE